MTDISGALPCIHQIAAITIWRWHVIHDRNVILLVALSGVKVHRVFVGEFTVGIDGKSLHFFTVNVSWLSTDHDVQNTYHA
ncbi:hypothetical protein [Aeromonas sp. NJAU223]|uniref:hypothetical protein n=1 Tax=Aeromonas sp. NJAU223 TaxID=3115650 RepID=UPI003DA99A87